jgi:hypothetical protein
MEPLKVWWSRRVVVDIERLEEKRIEGPSEEEEETKQWARIAKASICRGKWTAANLQWRRPKHQCLPTRRSPSCSQLSTAERVKSFSSADIRVVSAHPKRLELCGALMDSALHAALKNLRNAENLTQFTS